MLLLALPASASAQDSCPNADKRWGPSQDLPDCRAYELVTPIDTNGRTPYAGIGYHTTFGDAVGQPISQQVTTPPVSADGEKFQYQLNGTALDGIGGNGWLSLYVAERTENGWTSTYRGFDPATQARGSIAGGASHDFEYQNFAATHEAQDAFGFPQNSFWTRQPDGSFRPNGEGSVPADPDADFFDNGFDDDAFAQQRYITPSGDHQVVYASNPSSGGAEAGAPLTPNAPGGGIRAVYDRTPEGLYLVSVLPGGSAPTQNSYYAGASLDGSVIGFIVESSPHTLYVRINNETTKQVATFGGTGDGVAALSNNLIYYRKNGNLFVYDFLAEQQTQITTTGEARFVRVSEDGSRVFFLSNHQLDGANGVDGQPNLYVWDGSDVQFIATTRNADNSVTGLPSTTSEGGLSKWTLQGPADMAPGTHARGNINTTRATDDGGVFVFTSSANITGQNPGLDFQIYRWESATDDISCVSCPTDGSNTTGKSILNDGSVFSGSALDIPNMTPDGEEIYFESDQRLATGDRDGVSSVYQWRDGEISLLSSGNSERGDHLVGTTRDGSQVFINTTDKLVPQPQQGSVAAIYSVRVNGGFPVPESVPPCSGNDCQEDLTGPPATEAPGSEGVFPGNPSSGPDRDRCGRLDKRADRLQKRAKQLKKQTKKAKNNKKAKKLKQRAKKTQKKAKQKRKQANDCRRGSQ